MPKIKLTKTAVDAATPQERDYELRDTTIPGFLVKVTPTGRKIFMVAYVAHNGQRRKPAIGRYGEITVEQARNIAQDWLAEVRRGVDPSAERAAARQFLILWVLSHQGTKRFGELRRAVTGISEKMLIQELKELELDGIIGRKDFKEVPPRVEYSLTALGIELGEATQPLCDWGAKNIERISGQPMQVEPAMAS